MIKFKKERETDSVHMERETDSRNVAAAHASWYETKTVDRCDIPREGDRERERDIDITNKKRRKNRERTRSTSSS